MFRKLTLVVLGLVLLSGEGSWAQDSVLNEMYGNGVHAYFSGQYADSYEYLSSAISAGSEDPRCYYFRGLSCLRLGRAPDAKIDFEKGAELETVDTDRFYDVSKSLERCQGRARAMLEKYRGAARVQAYQNLERQRFERYERIRRNEPNVILRPVPSGNAGTTDTPPADDAEPDAIPDENPADTDEPPADDDAAAGEGDMPADGEVETNAEEPPAEDDPFGSEEKPADNAAAPEDAATEDGDAADEMPADEDAPAADEPAEGDAEATEDTPAKDDPAEPKTDDDDPFSS